MTDAFQVQVGDIAVHVACELLEVADQYASLYKELRRHNEPVAPLIRMAVIRQPWSPLGGRRYTIYGDGLELFRDRPREEVLPYLEWGINRSVIRSCTNYLQIHAASMARAGHGFIFAGYSGSGKSTLAAALLARGWSYFCDEFALIEPTTLNIHPFPKALCIKSGSFDVVKNMGLPLTEQRYYIKALKRRVGFIPSHSQNKLASARPCAVRAIIFPHYSNGQKARFYTLTRAQAVMALAGLVLNRPALGAQAGQIIASLARHVQCYGLECGEIGETCDLLDAHLTE